MRTTTAAGAALALAFTLIHTSPATSLPPTQQAQTITKQSDQRDFITAVRGSTGKKLSNTKRAALLRIGRSICREYQERGYVARTTRAINRDLRREYDLTKRQARSVSLSARTYLCPPVSQDDEPEVETNPTPAPQPTPAPTPQPTPAPTPTPQKIQLPDSSGWEVATNQFSGSRYLRANADSGKTLPLGNAAQLGLSLYGSTCSGEWYESAFVGIEFLDANGSPIPNRFGRTTELLGYLAGTSDFSSAGCGGETVTLSDWTGVTAIRIVSNSGSTGTVALFGTDYL